MNLRRCTVLLIILALVACGSAAPKAKHRIPAWPWLALADCESGDGTGTRPYHPWWGYDKDFEGGFNFTNETWRDYGGLRYAKHAYGATAWQQLIVARRVLADVGWRAWPKCSRKLGLR